MIGREGRRGDGGVMGEEEKRDWVVTGGEGEGRGWGCNGRGSGRDGGVMGGEGRE